MDFKFKVVTALPIQRLWDNVGFIDFEKISDLNSDEITEIINAYVSLVIANCGDPLLWIADEDKYRVWKGELKCRIVNTNIIDLNHFVGNYAFKATKWVDGANSVIILFEKLH